MGASFGGIIYAIFIIICVALIGFGGFLSISKKKNIGWIFLIIGTALIILLLAFRTDSINFFS